MQGIEGGIEEGGFSRSKPPDRIGEKKKGESSMNVLRQKRSYKEERSIKDEVRHSQSLWENLAAENIIPVAYPDRKKIFVPIWKKISKASKNTWVCEPGRRTLGRSKTNSENRVTSNIRGGSNVTGQKQQGKQRDSSHPQKGNHGGVQITTTKNKCPGTP